MKIRRVRAKIVFWREIFGFWAQKFYDCPVILYSFAVFPRENKDFTLQNLQPEKGASWELEFHDLFMFLISPILSFLGGVKNRVIKREFRPFWRFPDFMVWDLGWKFNFGAKNHFWEKKNGLSATQPMPNTLSRHGTSRPPSTPRIPTLWPDLIGIFSSGASFSPRE